MLKIIFFSLSLFVYLPTSNATQSDCVILLHGLGRSHHAMSSIEKKLKQHHYFVINQDYPSTRQSINTLANNAIQPMVNQCLAKHPQHIFFVTHSLGGIILGQYLETHTVPNLSRIVMLSPPHHGSPLADLLHRTWLFQKIMGPAGQELTTRAVYAPQLLNPNVQIGIIAGDFNLIPFSKHFFHDKNDGKVSISSAQLDQMTDFIVLPVSHTFMMNNRLVQQQILAFINSGRFSNTSK